MDDPNVSESVTTAAGRALLDMIYNPDSSYSERMVTRAILAIEAEARVGAVSEQASDWMRRAAEKIAADPSGLRTALEAWMDEDPGEWVVDEYGRTMPEGRLRDAIRRLAGTEGAER